MRRFPFCFIQQFLCVKSFQVQTLHRKRSQSKENDQKPIHKTSNLFYDGSNLGITSHNQLNAMAQSVLSAAGVAAVWARIHHYSPVISHNDVQICSHVPIPLPSPLRFFIALIVTDRLMDRMGSAPILPITVDTTINL